MVAPQKCLHLRLKHGCSRTMTCVSHPKPGQEWIFKIEHKLQYGNTPNLIPTEQIPSMYPSWYTKARRLGAHCNPDPSNNRRQRGALGNQLSSAKMRMENNSILTHLATIPKHVDEDDVQSRSLVPISLVTCRTRGQWMDGRKEYATDHIRLAAAQ